MTTDGIIVYELLRIYLFYSHPLKVSYLKVTKGLTLICVRPNFEYLFFTVQTGLLIVISPCSTVPLLQNLLVELRCPFKLIQKAINRLSLWIFSGISPISTCSDGTRGDIKTNSTASIFFLHRSIPYSQSWADILIVLYICFKDYSLAPNSTSAKHLKIFIHFFF